MSEKKILEARMILAQLGVPKAQQNKRSALTLLALVNVKPEQRWDEAERVFLGITQIMAWVKMHYGVEYAPNSRESFRRQTIHQFVEMGMVLTNKDKSGRAVNSPQFRYEIETTLLNTIQRFGKDDWLANVDDYKNIAQNLQVLHHNERVMTLIEVTLPDGRLVNLSGGGQNVLLKRIVDDFCSRFTPQGVVAYLGDAGQKISSEEKEFFNGLGIELDFHGKMPDLVVYMPDKQWLVIVEAVTSHGPIDNKRKLELEKLFRGRGLGLVYVTAFPDRKTMTKFFREIAWETDVWLADSPSHLIHFNGERFLGPYSI